MAGEKIYAVDDEEDILDLIEYFLSKEGYKITRFTNGEEIVKALKHKHPDLILLDIMLPGMDGLDVCRVIKQNQAQTEIPIIMLTAKGDEADIVKGLELGADDYVIKPFSSKVLTARIKAILRRKNQKLTNEDDVLQIHDIIIHPGRHEVILNGESLDLTYSEFRLLQFLAGRPGWVFTRYQIVDALRGEDYPVTERAIDVQVVGLRKKLGKFGDYIETVRGVGYKFKE
ncbi:MAG: response regulator transcription factor [Calditrichaceae bacterium]